MITIVLDGEFPSFNGMVAKTKIHWGAYSSSKRNLTNRVAKEARKYLPELFKLGGTITYEVGFIFEWYVKNKRKDQDNICFAKKYILDGLQDANIIASDGWKVVNAGFYETFKIDKTRPRVEVTILTKQQFIERFKNNNL